MYNFLDEKFLFSALVSVLHYIYVCIVPYFPNKALAVIRSNKSLEDYFSLDCHYQLINRASLG